MRAKPRKECRCRRIDADLIGGFIGSLAHSNFLDLFPPFPPICGITCFMKEREQLYQMTSTVFVTPKLHMARHSKENFFPCVSAARHAHMRNENTKHHHKSNHINSKQQPIANNSIMASNNNQRRPSGTVSLSPEVSDDDNDIKLPASVSRGVAVEENATLHDRSHQRGDGNEETQVIPSTSSTTRTHGDRGHVAAASSSTSRKKKKLSSPAGSGARKRSKYRRRRSEMTAEERAEADRERRRANVHSATASRKRQKAELEALRRQAGQLQAANFAVMRENQSLEFYISYYNAIINGAGAIAPDPATIDSAGGSPLPVMGSNTMINCANATTQAPAMQAPVPPIQAQTQTQMQPQPQATYQYSPATSNTTSFPQSISWQNQQQVQQPASTMAYQPRGQEGILWAQQRQIQDQQTQQAESNEQPDDIFMRMAAILLAQAQLQQLQQQTLQQQQQQQYQANTTAPAPSPWSQFPISNGNAPVVSNSTNNLAQIDVNALINQIMNYGGKNTGGMNFAQPMPQTTATTQQQAQQAQQAFFPVSYGYEQPQNSLSVGQQEQNSNQQGPSIPPGAVRATPPFFSTGGTSKSRNETSTTQQDDRSFWLEQLQGLGLPDEIRINLQDVSHDEVLDDDLFDKQDEDNFGYREK